MCIRSVKGKEAEVHAAIFYISSSKNLKTIQSSTVFEDTTLRLDFYQDKKDLTVVSFLFCNFVNQKVLFRVKNRRENHMSLVVDANTT